VDLLPVVPYYTAHLAEGLARIEGLDARVASPDYAWDPEVFRRFKVRRTAGLLNLNTAWSRLPSVPQRVLKFFQYLVNLLGLLLQILFTRPDIVHIQFLPLLERRLPLELWFLRILRAVRLPIAYTVHNVLPQDNGQALFHLYEKTYRLPDILICHDDLAAHRLAAEFSIDPGRCFVVPHGPFFAAPHDFSPEEARQRLGLAGAECIVLWSGILRPYKGVSFLLRSWRLVCDRYPHARLVIQGTGQESELSDARRLVRELGIEDRVRLDLRFVSCSELEDYLSAADVLVYPYRQITMSGALMTGISRRKAMIATDLPAFREVLQNGRNALLVHYGDTEELATSLKTLIGNPHLRESLARNLQQTSDSLPDWTDIAIQTLDCYDAAMTKHRPLMQQQRTA